MLTYDRSRKVKRQYSVRLRNMRPEFRSRIPCCERFWGHSPGKATPCHNEICCKRFWGHSPGKATPSHYEIRCKRFWGHSPGKATPSHCEIRCNMKGLLRGRAFRLITCNLGLIKYVRTLRVSVTRAVSAGNKGSE